MSERQISLSPDIQQLINEGFEVQICSGYLRILRVPYLTPGGEVGYGELVSAIRWAGDVCTPPADHVAWFAGERPHRADGRPLRHIIGEGHRKLAEGVEVDFRLSSKPPAGSYPDFFEKVMTYVALLEGPAHSVDETVTAKTFAPVEPAQDDGVFNYWDTAPGHVGICDAMDKLRSQSVGIVGVGGTGAYVLDLVAKCPVREVHIFDGDDLFSHNAFRSPGAASLDELRQRPTKVAYYAELYSRMHRHIVPHLGYVDASHLDELEPLDFVFLCMDRGGEKRQVVEQLEAWGKPFIDVGMGIEVKQAAVLGILTITTSTPAKRDHVHTKKRIPFDTTDEGDDYSNNIQIADLNALNAALAVIRWKKHCGFYHDLEGEHFTAYTIDGNAVVNEDFA